MTDKELLEKAAHRFRLIADDTNRITSGNLSHNLTCLRGFALRAAESIEKHLQEEPVSEDLEEASKEWLRPQLDKSYADYGETKMMELTHFDGYAMLDAIKFGAQWLKEQVMVKAIDAELLEGHLIRQKGVTHPLYVGDKVKVIVVKED